MRGSARRLREEIGTASATAISSRSTNLASLSLDSPSEDDCSCDPFAYHVRLPPHQGSHDQYRNHLGAFSEALCGTDVERALALQVFFLKEGGAH